MFRKEFQVKSQSLLSGSEKKKVRRELVEKLSLAEVESSWLVSLDILASKTVLGSGSTCSVYFLNKVPILFKVENELIPTIFSLNKLSFNLPVLYTNAFVKSKLINGADLMVPGILLPEGGLPDFQVGQVVAIATYDEPELVVAVGSMCMDLKTLLAEDKGKAVVIYHTIDDKLYKAGEKFISEAFSELPLEKEQEQVQPTVEETELTPTSPENEQLETTKLAPEEVDEVLVKSLLMALKLNLQLNSISLPISTSQLYSQYLLPNRPYNQLVDIKDSSFKKLAKFIKFVEKLELLSCKETKGITYVKAIHNQHPSVKDLELFKTVAAAELSKTRQKLEEMNLEQQNNLPTIQCQLLYKPNKKTPLTMEDKLFTLNEVKTVVDAYVQKNHLIEVKNKRNVVLDPTLASLVNRNELGVVPVATFPRDKLAQRLVLDLDVYHRITLPNQPPTIYKGEIQPIQIELKTKNNKQISCLTNLNWYGFDCVELEKQLRVLCASSTTIDEKPAKGGGIIQQLIVQGDQRKILTRFFTEKGLPNKCLIIIDSLKKKKK